MHKPFESQVSYSRLGLLDISPVRFQSQTSGRLVSPEHGSKDWGSHNPCSSEMCSIFARPFHLVASCSGSGVFGKTVPLPLLDILTWPFYLLSSRRHSASSQVSFRENCSIDSCTLGVSVGGGEFRVFLGRHLEPPPDSSVNTKLHDTHNAHLLYSFS